MKRAAAAAAALFLAWAPAASAHGVTSADLLRRGISHALAEHWLRPDDAARYRRDVNRALWDERRLPKLRARLIASQLAQLTPLWDSYTSPRALALFAQLEQNLSYFETHRVPDTPVDVSDAEGVVYRWFPYKGFEFHPLASFSALANAASQHDAERTQALASALLDRAIPRGRRLIWEYSFSFGSGRPPWASGMAQALAAQALARAGALLGDPSLTAAAARAYAPSPTSCSTRPPVCGSGCTASDREVVLNAQLQTIVSLHEYGATTGNAGASALAQRLEAAAKALFPRFDTGDWSLYELRGAHASLGYEQYVTELLGKVAFAHEGPVLGRRRAALPGLPRRAEDRRGHAAADALSAAAGWLARHGVDPDHAVAARVGHARRRRQGADVPARARDARAHVDAAADARAGHVPGDRLGDQLRRPARTACGSRRSSSRGRPPRRRTCRRSSPSRRSPGRRTIPARRGCTSSCSSSTRPARTRPQTVDLGQQPVSGTTQVALPPGTWDATLEATNSAGQTATLDLGAATGVTRRRRRRAT